MKSNQPHGRAGSCPPMGLCQILGGKKVLRFFLIRVGQNWVIKGGHFSVVNSSNKDGFLFYVFLTTCF